mmetsp:Transcript_39878/g.85398  ORF Transcript_39878/g.85398 Transcript_39878/m.85398 type:complete len:477 (+) Transcript_39878:68-1498(+)
MSQVSGRSGRLTSRRDRTNQAAATPLPQSARAGHEVPGYAGHIPGVGPENVYGKTFRHQNWHASMGRGAKESIVPQLVRTASAPSEVVPGYMGHMPGKSENVYAKGWTDSKVLSRSALHPDGYRQKEYAVSSELKPPSGKLKYGRPGSEIPGYSGYIGGVRPEPLVMGGTTRNINDLVHSARGLETTHRPQHYVPLHGPAPPTRVAHKNPKHVIPGYTGHLAGSAENVHAKINGEAVHEQYKVMGIDHKHGFYKEEYYDERTPRSPKLPREVEDHHVAVRQAVSLPGYAGHIPGKIANNIMGKTFRVANIRATRERFANSRSHRRYNEAWNPIAKDIPSSSRLSGGTWTPRTGSVASLDGRSDNDWVSLASSGVSLTRGRTMPGQMMREPSLESIASTSSCSSAVSVRSGFSRSSSRGGNGLGRSTSAPPPRRGPLTCVPGTGGGMGQTLNTTMKAPGSARSCSTRASVRSSSASR